MHLNVVGEIDDSVRVRHALVSVADKQGLETLVPALFRVVPDLTVYSTGGTYDRLRQMLPEPSRSAVRQVSEYTGQPEMQGGLVKTLDFRIYLGLLSETYNEAHRQDLERTRSVTIDLVVSNLYPFARAVESADATPETVRGNIDIGGPCMVRASAKNYLRVAVLTDPADYAGVTAELQATGGALSLATRLHLAQKAFRHTAEYERRIAAYMEGLQIGAVRGTYRIHGGKT